MPAYITDSLYYLLSMNYQVLYLNRFYICPHRYVHTHYLQFIKQQVDCNNSFARNVFLMDWKWMPSTPCNFLPVRLPSLLSSFSRTKTPASSSLHSSIPYAFQFNLCTGNISSSVCSRTILKYRHLHSNWTLLLITKKSPCHVFPPICDILVSAPWLTEETSL